MSLLSLIKINLIKPKLKLNYIKFYIFAWFCIFISKKLKKHLFTSILTSIEYKLCYLSSYLISFFKFSKTEPKSIEQTLIIFYTKLGLSKLALICSNSFIKFLIFSNRIKMSPSLELKSFNLS